MRLYKIGHRNVTFRGIVLLLHLKYIKCFCEICLSVKPDSHKLQVVATTQSTRLLQIIEFFIFTAMDCDSCWLQQIHEPLSSKISRLFMSYIGMFPTL